MAVSARKMPLLRRPHPRTLHRRRAARRRLRAVLPVRLGVHAGGRLRVCPVRAHDDDRLHRPRHARDPQRARRLHCRTRRARARHRTRHAEHPARCRVPRRRRHLARPRHRRLCRERAASARRLAHRRLWRRRHQAHGGARLAARLEAHVAHSFRGHRATPSACSFPSGQAQTMRSLSARSCAFVP